MGLNSLEWAEASRAREPSLTGARVYQECPFAFDSIFQIQQFFGPRAKGAGRAVEAKEIQTKETEKKKENLCMQIKPCSVKRRRAVWMMKLAVRAVRADLFRFKFPRPLKEEIPGLPYQREKTAWWSFNHNANTYFFISPLFSFNQEKKNPPFAIFSLLFIVPPAPPPPIYMNPHTLRLFSCFSQFTIQIVSDDCPKSRGNQLFCGTPPMEDFSFSLRRLPFLFLKAEEIFSSLCVCVFFLLNVEPNGAIGTRPSIVITAEESIAAAFPESVSSSLLFVAFLLVFYLFIMNVFPSEWQQHFSFQS